MKNNLLTIIALVFIFNHSIAQQATYDVIPGYGNGIRFWSNNSYKIHMGNNSEYHYGPVTDYSIKMNMSSNAGRGWTWGKPGLIPIAALSNIGKMQIANSFIANGGGIFNGSILGNSVPVLAVNNTWKNYSVEYTLNRPFAIRRNTSNNEAYFTFIQDTRTHIVYQNDEASSAIQFKLINTDTETGGGANANSNVVLNLYSDVKGGKVGIGTTTPSSALDVNGQITVSSSSGTLFYSSHTGVQTFKLTNDDLIGVNNIKINDDGKGEGIDWQNGRNISMYTIGQGGFNAYRFGTTTTFPYVFEGGNVGIGNTNPTEKLVVNGKILAEEIKIQNVPSSDYVFEPDYNLRSIQEVETFIQKNKHLPNIPSAEEFKENGIGLGEMDNMLLRKVEELTLYMIEQNKKIDQLVKQNDNLTYEVESLKNHIK